MVVSGEELTPAGFPGCQPLGPLGETDELVSAPFGGPFLCPGDPSLSRGTRRDQLNTLPLPTSDLADSDEIAACRQSSGHS